MREDYRDLFFMSIGNDTKLDGSVKDIEVVKQALSDEPPASIRVANTD
jgi:hypothetical protein